VDESLNWRYHIAHICKTLAKCVGIMYKIRNYIDINTSITLYYTLFYPYLTYCNIVWGNTYKSYLQPVVLLQKKIIRVIAGNRIYLEHTDPLFEKTKIMKFHDLHRYIVAQFMFNFHYQQTPVIFNEMFTHNVAIHNYNTRQCHGLHMPKVKSNIAKRCLCYEGPAIWNSILNDIDVNCSMYTFKANLKKHILND
jgi:hypothetical protein